MVDAQRNAFGCAQGNAVEERGEVVRVNLRRDVDEARYKASGSTAQGSSAHHGGRSVAFFAGIPLDMKSAA